MKKSGFILKIFISVLFVFLISLTNKVLASTEKYQTHSAPVFYGAVEINLRVGDNFDKNDPIFRTFAQDEYGTDLTQSIKTESSNLSTSNVGTYTINYSVTDCSNRTSTISIPVNVTTDGERTVKRKLYNNKDFYNMEIMNSNRGNKQDRQNLGIYMNTGASLKIRQAGATNNLKLELLTNNSSCDSEYKLNDSWQTITSEYPCVPFIKTSFVDSIRYNYRLTQKDSWNLIGNPINNSDTFYLYNTFTTQESKEQIEIIKMPVWKCSGLTFYLKQGDGEYKELKSAKLSNYNGDYMCILDTPETITSDTFTIAVKYTGSLVPVTGTSDAPNFSYYSAELGKDIKLFRGNFSDGACNYGPITVQTTANKTSTDNYIEINIDDLYNENSSLKHLDYYLYGDNSATFYDKWTSSQNYIALLENDRVSFLITTEDKSDIISSSEYGFSTYEELFDYYSEFLEMYDTFVGLQYNPDNSLNQNYKSKYLVKPDAGYEDFNVLAYYSNNFVSLVGNTLSLFLQKDWTSLHEFAHGYTGYLEDTYLGGINIGEIANNVLGYYYQQKYLNSNDSGWLGKISDIESDCQNARLQMLNDNKKFNDIAKYNDMDEVHTKLYFFINLLNKIGNKEAVQEWYRDARKEARDSGISTTVNDLIAQGFSDGTHYNVIPYLESWGVDISEDIQKDIANKDYKPVWYLRNLINDDTTAQDIASELNLEGLYSLVDNDQLSQYNLKGTMQISLSDTQFNDLKDSKILLKNGTQTVKEINVSDSNISVSDIPIGIYEIELSSKTYKMNPTYIIISEGQNSETSLSYTQKDSSELDDENMDTNLDPDDNNNDDDNTGSDDNNNDTDNTGSDDNNNDNDNTGSGDNNNDNDNTGSGDNNNDGSDNKSNNNNNSSSNDKSNNINNSSSNDTNNNTDTSNQVIKITNNPTTKTDTKEELTQTTTTKTSNLNVNPDTATGILPKTGPSRILITFITIASAVAIISFIRIKHIHLK